MKNIPKPKSVSTAIIYIRVSSQEQVDGYSLQNQEKACRAFAENRGARVLEIFREEGESAKTANRTELQKLLRYCAKNHGKIGYLVVYKLDRLARQSSDHFALKVIFKRHGIQLQSATEPLTEDPSRRFNGNSFGWSCRI
jgi:site-specific DNA recombinase